MTPLRPKEAEGCPRCPGGEGQQPCGSPGVGTPAPAPGTPLAQTERKHVRRYVSHAHTSTHGTLGHRCASGTEVSLSHGGAFLLSPGAGSLPHSHARQARSGPIPEHHCPLVSPGFTGYCLCMLNTDSRLSADTQLLRVTTFPGASDTLQGFLGSGSQHWLALTRTLTLVLGL